MLQRTENIFFVSEKLHLKWFRKIVPIMSKILFIVTRCVNDVFPKFHMSIRESFSKTISLPVTNECDKWHVMHISTVLGHVYHMASRSIL